MFNDYFYHGITRKAITAFGALFDKIRVRQVDSDGNVLSEEKVSLAYGPKDKFLARLDQQDDVNENRVAIKLPRMSFEITGFTYDSQSKLNRHNTESVQIDNNTKRRTYSYAPYILNMQLSVIAKRSEDALQIIEQIVPYFQPEYTIKIKGIDQFDAVKYDMPVTLQSISPEDDYAADFRSRRSLIYTLDFTLKVRYYGPLSDKAIIRHVEIDVNDLNSSEILAEIDADVTTDTSGDTITTTITYPGLPEYEPPT